jgi:LuxR family transcriptional regulator, quorum-sensing system regulator SdiA
VGRSAEVDVRLATLTKLAPSGYALGLHIRFASALIMVQTYDPEWVEIYTDRGFLMADPLVFWAFAQEGAIRWSALNLPDPQNILSQATAFGLNFGVAISHGPNASRSIGGFARHDREFLDDEIVEISQLVTALHHETTPPEQLSTAQVEALRLIANGYRYADAAAQLAISESALKARLRTARERLLCRTIAEAIQRAAENKLL